MGFHYIKTIEKKSSKYGNKKTAYNGVLYDSKKEAFYARTLDLMRHAKNKSEKVVDVVVQPDFQISINGKKICKYRADFKVKYADGREEIVDVKGMKTAVYKLKKKLVEAQYGVNIVEV